MALSIAAFVITCLSALSAPAPARSLAAAAILVLLAAAAWAWRRPDAPLQVRVTPEAGIHARADASSEPRPLQVRFVAPWLIVLGDGRSVVAVWPDRLGANEFRRLAVACRWCRPAATA